MRRRSSSTTRGRHATSAGCSASSSVARVSRCGGLPGAAVVGSRRLCATSPGIRPGFRCRRAGLTCSTARRSGRRFDAAYRWSSPSMTSRFFAFRNSSRLGRGCTHARSSARFCARRPACWRSRSSRSATSRRSRASRRNGSTSRTTPPTRACSPRQGRRRTGSTCSQSERSSRGRICGASSTPPRSSGSSCALREREGGAASKSRVRTSAGSVDHRTRSSPCSFAVHFASRTRHSGRGSASPCSKRCSAVRRS